MASPMVNGDPDLHGETRLKAYSFPIALLVWLLSWPTGAEGPRKAV